jgi:hypothetical protein
MEQLSENGRQVIAGGGRWIVDDGETVCQLKTGDYHLHTADHV